MTMPKVLVSIVAWNSMKYLPDALESVGRQTHPDIATVVVDNGSSDGAADHVRERHPEAIIIRNNRNLGFARAHNQAIAYGRAHLAAEGEDLFVLVLNPDVILDERYVERLVDAVSRRPEIAAAAGKLLRVHDRMDGDMRDPVFTNIIDSAGIRLQRSRRASERGGGRELTEEYERTAEVFGVSGAAAMYRVSALKDVAYRGEYFDEDFFAYKEDIDLAWRLRLRGWGALYVPAARAYHYRAAAGAEKQTLREIVRGRKGRSRLVSYLSYRNHLLALIKNEHAANAARDLPRIIWFETRKFVYILAFETRALKGLPHALRAAPRMMKKRRLTFERARAGAKDIRKWFD